MFRDVLDDSGPTQIKIIFDKVAPLRFYSATLQMKTNIKKTSSSCLHGVQMRQAAWRSGLKAAGNVEALF